MHIALNRTFVILAGCCLAVSFLAFGCGGGSDYAVGDCLSEEVNEDGEAEKVSCDSEDSFTVEELARNGGQPDCGPDSKIIYEGHITTLPIAYVTDAVSGTTYCGHDNYNPYGSAYPSVSDDES